MRSFTYSAHIDRAPERVFAFMMDFNNAPRWRSLVRRLEVVGGGPVRRGSQVVVTMDVMGKTRQGVSEVWSRGGSDSATPRATSPASSSTCSNPRPPVRE